MAERLTEEEIDYWRQFHLLHALDDLHRIYRPAALIASAGSGKQAGEAFTQALDLLAPKPKAAKRQVRRARVIRPPKE